MSAPSRPQTSSPPPGSERSQPTGAEAGTARPLVRVVAFDHLVLAVADVERSLAWYRDVLGLRGERVEEWRRGEAPFPSVRIDQGVIIDLVERPAGGEGRNLDHLCLVVEPGDVDAVVASGVPVVAGPGPRFGARGTGWSVYVEDPDGNVVELRSYEPPGGRGE